MAQTPTPTPWDQQPNESDKLYTYFCAHRDQGPARRMDKTAKALDKSVNYLYDLSTRHNWKDRAEAWDKHQDEQWAKEVATERRKMAKEHAQLADTMMEKLLEGLDTLDPQELKAGDMSKWAEVVTKIKRVAYGEPENIALTGPQGGPIQIEAITAMSIEERRRRLSELRENLNQRIPESPQ